MRPCRSTTKRFMRRALPGFEVARGRGAIDLHPAKRDLRDVEPVDHPGDLAAADGESARRGLAQQDLVCRLLHEKKKMSKITLMAIMGLMVKYMLQVITRDLLPDCTEQLNLP